MTERYTTTDGGAPAPSDERSLTVGPDGPILLQDHYLIEQMAQFNRERIPERQPHAKGGGAFGHFEVTNDVSKYTRAAVFQPGTKTDMEIIGVVKDIKYTGIRDEIPEQAYEPYLASSFLGQMTVYIRTSSDPGQMFSSLRAKVRELDANIPVYAMRTTEEQINNSLTTERLIASLSAVFGFLATLLAVIGLYGVMAYTVARRTREIGIRMALGAAQGNVIWMVMREVLMLVAVGVAAGIPAAWALARFVESQLFGMKGRDPVTMALAAVGLALVASLAGYVPALRASRVDPLNALRYE